MNNPRKPPIDKTASELWWLSGG